jgi:hypothetical protein
MPDVLPFAALLALRSGCMDEEREPAKCPSPFFYTASCILFTAMESSGKLVFFQHTPAFHDL